MFVHPVEITTDVRAWFTGRDLERVEPPAVGAAGNLAHRRPHLPDELARERRHLAEVTGVDVERWHLMRQVHGARVATVTSSTPLGAELVDVDAAVTTATDRALGVLTADCVPVLLAADGAIGAVHAGRRGLVAGVVPAALERLAALGAAPATVVAAIGPAIRGCCYEVPGALRDQVVAEHPGARATTTWSSPALDLPAAVADQLTEAGVGRVDDVGVCTRCDPQARFFSHRADPGTGRALGLVVRHGHEARTLEGAPDGNEPTSAGGVSGVWR